jgi:hypothetical protein
MRKEGVTMKRWVIPIALVLVLGLGSYAIFAQQQDQSQNQSQQGMMGGGTGGGMMQQGGGMQGGMQGGMMGRGMGRGMMQGQGGTMGRGMMGQGGMGCPACATMAAGLMHESVTATSDGGVVVSVAGKLIKYDANLNKMNEVDLNIDWARVHQMAQQIMQNCPMQRRMMQQPQGQPQRQGQPTP